MDTGTRKIGRLLDCASKGNVEGVMQLLDEGLPVDSPDYDGRTAMHLAASEGHYEVVAFLLKKQANVNPVDRWRKTPLTDARRYETLNAKNTKGRQYTKVCQLLIDNNGSTSSPFEIDLDEKQLRDAESIGESTCEEIKVANWRGTKVAARIIHRDRQPHSSPKLVADNQLTKQLSILQRLRHPNIVQFLGAVTNFQNKTKPLVLVTEYLPNGDLHQLLQRKKGKKLTSKDAVNHALDIARGMNYLHHRTRPIVHCELNPMNLLRDAAGHLKVGGIGLTTLMRCICDKYAQDAFTGAQSLMYGSYGSYVDFKIYMARYRAPEFIPSESHKAHRSVDVYSFGMILKEMFQGPSTSLASRRAHHGVVPYKPGADHSFTGRTSTAFRLGELLKTCLSMNPLERPSFESIIVTLEHAQAVLMKKHWWAPRPVLHMGSNLVSTLSTHWYNCILKTKKALNNSIVSVEDSIRGGPAGRSRRGSTMIPIQEEVREEAREEDKDGDKEKRSIIAMRDTSVRNQTGRILR